MCRSENRDQIEAALGKVRDLQGEVWAQRRMLLFSGWFRVTDPQVHVALEDVGWQLTTSMLGHKVWASQIAASLKRFCFIWDMPAKFYAANKL